MKDSKIYPMLIPLQDQSAELYRVAFPGELKEKMLRLESESNAQFKRYLGHRLPFDSLKKILSRYLGIIHMSPVSESSDDKNWLIALAPVNSVLLGRAFRIWVESFYVAEQELASPRSKIGNWKQFAQEVMDSIDGDTFACRNVPEEVVLVKDGVPVKDSCCFDALPLIVVNQLKGKALHLDNRELPLWASGVNELMTQPDLLPDDDENLYTSSLVLHFSVQTIPSVKNAFLNVEVSKRRWLSSELEKKLYLKTDKCAYLPIKEHQFLEIWGGYRDKTVTWYTKDIRWYEALFPGTTLPDMKTVIDDPQNYVLGTSQPVYIPFDNQTDGIEHTQGTGIRTLVRKKVMMQVREMLDVPTDEQIAQKVCDGNNSDPERYFTKERFALADNHEFSDALKCALRGRKLSVEVWASRADNKSMDAAKAVCETFENHLKTSGISVEMRDLGLWCTPLEASKEKKDRNLGFFKRVREIEAKLHVSDHPVISVIVLRDKTFFKEKARVAVEEKGLSYTPDVDPKDALRIGFAKAGRLTQFITPEQFENGLKALERKIAIYPEQMERYHQKKAIWEANGCEGRKPQEPSASFINNVVKHTVLDAYRQLGIVADLHNFKHLKNGFVVGITMMNFTKSIYGRQTQPFPVVTVLDGNNKCVSVYCDLIDDDLMPYDEFLLAFARFFSQQAAKPGAEAYSPHKLHSFLTRFFEKHSALVMLENNALTRRCIKNVSNTSVDVGKQMGESFTFELVNRNEVLPLTIPASQLRGLIRIRTSTNHEVPDYYSEESKKGLAANAGVFDFLGTFYSLDSRAAHEGETLKLDETLTETKQALSHRRLVELYPLFAGDGDMKACLKDVHSLRTASIQFEQLRTQLPLPLNLVERDMLMEYCVLQKKN